MRLNLVQSYFPRQRLLHWLLSIAMVLGVLAYCVIVGMLARDPQSMKTILLLGLPAGGLALMFFSGYRRFQFALMILPIVMLAVPYTLPTGAGPELPVSFVLVLGMTTIWCASMYLRGRQLEPSPLNRPLLVFGAICSLSLPWSIIWRDPILIDHWDGQFIIVQVLALLICLLSISATLLIGNFLRTPRQLKFFTILFMVIFTLNLLSRIYNLPFRFLNVGGLWGTWFVAITYGLIIVQPGLRWWWRVGLFVLLGMTLNLIVIKDSFWVSGWMPAVIAIFAITWLHSRRAFFVLLIVGALLYQMPPVITFLAEVRQDNAAEGSTTGRVKLWRTNINLVQKHWVLGTGPAGYAYYYMTYNHDDARSTHNNFFDIAAQFGVIGLLVWFWIVIAAVREGSYLIQRAPPGFLRTLAVIATGGWISATASMFFGDWVLPFYYNVTIRGFGFTVMSWVFLGTLISIRHLLHTQAEECVQCEAWT